MTYTGDRSPFPLQKRAHLDFQEAQGKKRPSSYHDGLCGYWGKERGRRTQCETQGVCPSVLLWSEEAGKGQNRPEELRTIHRPAPETVLRGLF